MNRTRLLARCLEPVAMTEQALRVCIAVVSDDKWFADERQKAAQAAGGLPLLGDPRAPMTVENGVATIAIEGPLVRKAAGIAAVSGLTSYDAVRKDLRAALADPAVREIAFAFDSPGGEVSGLFELADEIFAARSRKPMRADVVQACSAAYVLAAAVGNMAIEQAGEVGSVGVVLGVQKPDPAGTVIEFVSSVSPLKRPDVATDEGRAEYQARVDYLGQKLVEKVALYRGVAADTDFGRGGVLIGAQAVAAGLVDRVGAAPVTTTGRVMARAAAKRTAMEDPKPDDAPAVPAPVEEKKADDMMPQCSGCESPFDAGAPMYCAACAGKAQSGDMPKDEQAAALSSLRTMTGAADLAGIVGTIAAWKVSHDAHPAALARIADLEGSHNRRELRALLAKGVAEGKLNPGRIRAGVVAQIAALDEDKGKAIASALASIPEALPAGTREDDAVLDAVCSVDPGAVGLRIVAAYVGNLNATHAPAVKQPAHDAARAQAHDAAIDETAARIDRAAAAARAAFTRTTTK